MRDCSQRNWSNLVKIPKLVTYDKDIGKAIIDHT
jgi:hypothetical protein